MTPHERLALTNRLRDTFPHLSLEVLAKPLDYIIRVRITKRNGSKQEFALTLVRGFPNPTLDEMAIYFAHELRKAGEDY